MGVINRHTVDSACDSLEVTAQSRLADENSRLVFPRRAHFRWWLLPAFALWILFIFWSVHLNRDQIWFSNLDQDSILLIDSLRRNADRQPSYLEQPGIGVYPLYGSMLQLFAKAGVTHVKDFRDLEKMPDPLPAVADIFYSGRAISLIVVSLLCLAVGVLSALLAGRATAGVLAFILALSSSGILLQSLLVRTEMTAVLFLSLAAIAAALSRRSATHLLAGACVWGAGALCAAAILTKVLVIPAVPFVWLLAAFGGPSWKPLPKDGEHPVMGQLLGLATVLILMILAMEVGPHFLWSFHWPWTCRLIGWGVGLLSLAAFPYWRCLDTRPKCGIFKTALFLAGLFAGVLLVMKAGHVETQGQDVLIWVGKMLVGDKSLQPYLGVVQRAGYVGVVTTLIVQVGGHYVLHTLYLPLVFTAFYFGGRRIPVVFVGVILSGVAIAGVCCARSAAPNYYIFSDIAFIMLSAVLIERSLRRGHKSVAIFLVVMLAVSALMQWAFIARYYPSYNKVLRDRVDYVYCGIYPSREFSNLILSLYGGDKTRIAVKVLEDPRVNGMDRGIDLKGKPNIRKYLQGEALPQL
jgi:hypothetical protein